MITQHDRAEFVRQLLACQCIRRVDLIEREAPHWQAAKFRKLTITKQQDFKENDFYRYFNPTELSFFTSVFKGGRGGGCNVPKSTIHISP